MRDTHDRVAEGVDLVKRAWTEAPLSWRGKFRPPIENLNILPRVYQKPHPPIWNACFMTRDSFEWTAKEGLNLLYVAYHVDTDSAGERVHWYIDALPRHGRRMADHEVCCCYHAHFTEREDVARLQALVEKPMAEYTGAGVEAATKPPDPVAYKGYAPRARIISARPHSRIISPTACWTWRSRERARPHPPDSKRSRHDAARPDRRFRLAQAARHHAVAGDLRAADILRAREHLAYSAAWRAHARSSSGFLTVWAALPCGSGSATNLNSGSLFHGPR